MTNPPRTLWEDSDGTFSGVAAQVRAAAMPWGAETRGAVALTFRVPSNSFNAFDVVDDGKAVLVTMLINPEEARGVGRWLTEAAAAADDAGPPIFQLDPAPEMPADRAPVDATPADTAPADAASKTAAPRKAPKTKAARKPGS